MANAETSQDLMPFHLNTKSIETARTLLADAETIGDIYSLPFPDTIAPLSDPARLQGLFDERSREQGINDPNIEFELLCHFDRNTKTQYLQQDFLEAAAAFYRQPSLGRKKLQEGEKSLEKVPFDTELKDAPLRHAIEESVAITYAHQKSAANKLKTPTDWHSKCFVFLSGRFKHGRGWHVDNGPNELVYWSTTDNGTLVTPHAPTHEFLKKSVFYELLDLRLNDRGAMKKWAAFTQTVRYCGGTERSAHFKLREQLEAEAQPTPINSVNVMTGATGHLQAALISQRRVFYRSNSSVEPV